MPPWFRFYSEAITDRKIERICRTLDQPKALIVGSWAILMAIGNDSPARGVLLLTESIPFTEADLADELGLDLDLTRAILEQFERFSMIHHDNGVMYLTNWGKRQFASDDSATRVRRYREKQKAEPSQDCNDGVTLQSRDSNAPEAEQSRTETEAETETETEAETETDGGVTDSPPLAPVAGTNNRDIPAITERLAELGIAEPALSRLPAHAWVTLDLVDAWWSYIETWPKAGKTVKVSSLINRLDKRRMPPGEYMEA